jgi:hypothetical protein
VRFREKTKEMKFTEFLIFLCRISFENYRGTPYENEQMYLKIDKCLPKFLAPVGLNQVFSYEEEFEYKPVVKKKKIVRKKTIKVESDSSLSEPSVEEEEEDESSEEDLTALVQLEPGKFEITAMFMENLAKERQARAERKKKKEEEKEAKRALAEAEQEALLLKMK